MIGKCFFPKVKSIILFRKIREKSNSRSRLVCVSRSELTPVLTWTLAQAV